MVGPLRSFAQDDSAMVAWGETAVSWSSVAVLECSVRDYAACSGVRSLQRMRRSSSTPALRQQRHKHQVYRQAGHHELPAADPISASVAKLSASVAKLSAKPRFVQLKAADGHLKLRKAPVKPEPVVLLRKAPAVQPVAPAEPVKIAAAPVEACASARTYFGKPLRSYEELLLLAGEGGLLDDELVQQRAAPAAPRTYFGAAITSYEELYCLSLGDDRLDDEVHRQFFCRDVFSYEELLTLGGPDARLDDECGKPCKAAQPFAYYCRELHSFEELWCLAGSDARLDAP